MTRAGSRSRPGRWPVTWPGGTRRDVALVGHRSGGDQQDGPRARAGDGVAQRDRRTARGEHVSGRVHGPVELLLHPAANTVHVGQPGLVAGDPGRRPSATTARMRGSLAAAPSASSPPIDNPTAAIFPGWTPDRPVTKSTAAATSRSPYQPKSMARPWLRPCPRASYSRTPKPWSASTTACARTAERVDPEPCSSTTAAPFRDGTYQPESATPSAVVNVTSEYARPCAPGVSRPRSVWERSGRRDRDAEDEHDRVGRHEEPHHDRDAPPRSCGAVGRSPLRRRRARGPRRDRRHRPARPR